MTDEWREQFESERSRLNQLITSGGNLGIKRFMALDNQVYQGGALPARTKELMGLVASMVLRCDDCITYHLCRCHDLGVSREEFMEAFNVALCAGGSIVIPHLRRVVDKLDALSSGD